ncbi:MAG: YfiR family protein [Spirochaetia bacterium]|nr:YfiR family protein [Spirochaetia bacterium]
MNSGYKKYFILLILIFFSLQKNIYSEKVEKEYNIKAYFIYNFIKFITWPNIENSKTFNIAILGENTEIEAPLKIIASQKTAKDMPIKIDILSKLENVNNSYHIIFIPKNNSEKLTKILRIKNESPVLIISEKKNMISFGVDINFLLLDNAIRFEINYSSLKKRNIKVNSNLLRLATTVY